MENIEIELRLVREFIAEHWDKFTEHCDERGEDPQFIYEQIGGEEA